MLEVPVQTPEIRSLFEPLPRSVTMLHSRRTGCELFFALPHQIPDNWGAISSKNALDPGDVIAHGFPPYYRDAPPGCVVDGRVGYTHVGIAYDHGVRFATPAGHIDVGVIGRITSNLSELRRLGESVRLGGGKQVSLSKPSEGASGYDAQ
jgi:hypothetical protein